MSSSILHQCPHCGHVSDISNALAAFIENPHCKQCGLSASESDSKMQDELAALFDRQMNMAQLHPAANIEPMSIPSQVPVPAPAPAAAYSITQLYQSAQRVAEQPSSVDVLGYHGLDPSTLTREQFGLFENAGAEQRQRLIQTWLLYEQLGNGAGIQDSAMDDSVMDVGDEDDSSAEPYMVSGYQSVPRQAAHIPTEPTTGEAYAGSKDPVYQGQGWWELAKAGPVESQYGAFEETRRYYPSCGVYRY
ncbi:hypothetical protein N7535_001355 [Penicillium sp. DV-2018c]|nr:hypothetical protein N7461_005402 [Penicillium sp. DV-2018c]KAJ5582735.1 hypothetical protein N7535_001355 [Penicillium sp. DV-2018c]